MAIGKPKTLIDGDLMAAPKPHVVPDETWPSMFRVAWGDGTVSDMVNLTRAMQAARGCDNG